MQLAQAIETVKESSLSQAVQLACNAYSYIRDEDGEDALCEFVERQEFNFGVGLGPASASSKILLNSALLCLQEFFLTDSDDDDDVVTSVFEAHGLLFLLSTSGDSEDDDEEEDSADDSEDDVVGLWGANQLCTTPALLPLLLTPPPPALQMSEEYLERMERKNRATLTEYLSLKDRIEALECVRELESQKGVSILFSPRRDIHMHCIRLHATLIGISPIFSRSTISSAWPWTRQSTAVMRSGHCCLPSCTIFARSSFSLRRTSARRSWMRSIISRTQWLIRAWLRKHLAHCPNLLSLPFLPSSPFSLPRWMCQRHPSTLATFSAW